MKEIIQKPVESTVVTVNEINSDKFFGVLYSLNEKYILQRNIDNGKISFFLLPLNHFTLRGPTKVYHYSTLEKVVDYILNTGRKVYQFDTLSELAKWMET